MLSRPLRRRTASLAVLIGATAAVVAPGLAAGADEIDDARDEAAQVADRIEELTHESEVLTERYLDARLAREDVEAQIDDARQRADRSGAALDGLRGEVRDLAVESYVTESRASRVDAVAGSSNPSDISVRRGYLDSVAADGDDLLDEYRGAQARVRRDTDRLEELRSTAEAAEREIAGTKDATEARLAELRELEEEVTGRLRELVAAEQRRREAEQVRLAEEARQAALAEAALQAEAAAAQEAAQPEAPQPDAGPAPSNAEPGPGPEPSAPTPAPAAPAPAPPAPAPPPPAPAASGAQAAINAARSVLGVPYKWAGATPQQGFDCSGLTMWAWAHAGRSLPHSSRAQYSMSRRIPVSQLQPGDLVFYNSPVSHVGLYIGGGQMIHAPRTGKNVEIQSIHYWSALVGGGRI